ncbi:MAG: transporter substrate-binding domain-containing protein [Pseudomonadota bacterium]
MRCLFVIFLWLATVLPGFAQQSEDPLVVATVTRVPFSLEQDGAQTGFSLDLWAAVADALDLDYEIRRFDGFNDMLNAIETGEADAAVANISITADRETRMDFSTPIFSAGVQVMLPPEGSIWSLLRAALSPRLLGLVAIGVGTLLLLGMLMWVFERRHQTYFGQTPKEAAFPAFWWALNILITGELVEKTPKSAMGRLFGVLMILCSLFLVSIFVAMITASVTLEALSDDVERITDLDGRRVGTTEGSTTSAYLDGRGVSHLTFASFDQLVAAFEEGQIDAVVFDGPILAHYVESAGNGRGRLIDRVFQSEYYAFALPSDSPLREAINRELLRLEDNGTYGEVQQRWFGAVYSE